MSTKEPYNAYVPTNVDDVSALVLFVPGVMGTRLQKPGGQKIWDPDDSLFMLGLSFKSAKKTKEKLGVSKVPVAEPINDKSDEYTDDQEIRGFQQPAAGFYGDLLKKMDEEFYTRQRETVQQLGISVGVFAIGYDWRQDVNTMADYVKGEIDRLQEMHATPRQKDTPVIIVTHSMGGLVTRCMLNKYKKIEKNVISVLHLNQPVIGSTQFYGYFKTGGIGATKTNKKGTGIMGLLGYIGGGIQNYVLATILGSSDIDFQITMSDMPVGPILLPTDAYMDKQWLTWSITSRQALQALGDLHDAGNPGKVKETLSIFDYYRDKSGYLGLFNKRFIDKYPRYIPKFYKYIKDAKKFHDKLNDLTTSPNMYLHPNTYEIASRDKSTLVKAHLRELQKHVDGYKNMGLYARQEVDKDDLAVDLIRSQNGDGTVPLSSQQALSRNASVRATLVTNSLKYSEHGDNPKDPTVMKYVCDMIESELIRYMGTVYFDFNSSTLGEQQQQFLRGIIRLMIMRISNNKSIGFRVEGWASLSGNEDYNLGLSRQRAESVVDYIADEVSKAGTITYSKDEIKKNYFEIEEFGEDIYASTDSSGQQRSRRVEVISLNNVKISSPKAV